MDLLGRYYTQQLFSDLLVSQISIEEPATILDLGAGDGALLKSAVSRWLKASFIATDIDTRSIYALTGSFPNVQIHHVDSLHTGLPQQLRISVGSVDVAVCNPPYLRLKSIKPYTSLLEKAGLPLCKKINFVTSDIVFLAQNLTLLKPTGQLGIILPDSLLTGHEFRLMRQNLLENHKLSRIIQLPENIFPKTEALTHILLIEKGSTTNGHVEIVQADSAGHCEQPLTIAAHRLIERMDHKFHLHFRSQASANPSAPTLASLNPEIRRGLVENRVLRGRRISQIHTTTLIHGCIDLCFAKPLGRKTAAKHMTAQPGDILLARVGRGCIGKVSLVTQGEAVISDCIYRIRVQPEYREPLFRLFASPEGQQWFKARSHGVCAKVISKTDLLQFPLTRLEASI